MAGPSNDRPTRPVPVILVRHGVTDWNRQGLIQGWTDTPLSETGRRQAARAAEALAGRAIGRVASSDLTRARETAELIARPHGLDVATHRELREYHCGEWEGRPFREVREADAERFRAWFDDPESMIPGGESMAGALRRAAPILPALMDGLAPAAARVIVARGGINRLLAAHLIDMPLASARRFALDNGSISVLEPFAGGWTVALWNGVAHLAVLDDDAGDTGATGR